MMIRLTTTCISLLSATSGVLLAELRLPAIIGDHMVLQQKQSNPIWGWDESGTEVTVNFAGQTKSATAGDDGRWVVDLDPLDATAEPAVMEITGTSRRELLDVLVGEVWMCSGQSNMGFSVGGDWKAEVETLASRHPELRLISVPQVGTQELKDDFRGKWESATPQTCASFSAVGFFFGRYLHEILGVPVGLIDNAWGGSSAEAWIRRSTLENDPRFAGLIEEWKQKEADLSSDAAKEKHAAAMEAWKTRAATLKAEGKPTGRAPRGRSSSSPGTTGRATFSLVSSTRRSATGSKG